MKISVKATPKIHVTFSVKEAEALVRLLEKGLPIEDRRGNTFLGHLAFDLAEACARTYNES